MSMYLPWDEYAINMYHVPLYCLRNKRKREIKLKKIDKKNQNKI